MKLVSLKLDPKEAKEEAGCAPTCDPPLYPYGTCLYLCEEELKKLGIKGMPTVGTEFPMQALVKVVGTNERETQDGKRQTLDLQLISMGLGIEEEDTSKFGKAAAAMYPKKG